MPRTRPPLAPRDLTHFTRVLRLPTMARQSALLALLPAVACSALAPHGDGHPLAVLVDVADVSGSVTVGNRCAELAAHVRPVLDDPRTQELDLLALATGGASGLVHQEPQLR